MKLTITRETLLAPLKTTAPLAAGKSTLPVLSHVLIEATPSGLTLTTSDTEAEIVARTGCETDVGWTACAPHRKLFDITRLLPAEAEISIEMQPNKLSVRSGRSRFSLTTLPAESFPQFDRFGFLRELRLEPASLERQMDAVSHAMAVSDVRFYLNGMLLHIIGDELIAVASDGHRLARYVMPGLPPGDDIACIVPRQAAIEMVKALRTTGEKQVTLRLGTNSVQLDFGAMRFTTKTIEGRYADYTRVIPHQFAAECTVGRTALSAAIQRVGLASTDEKYHGMAITSTDSGLALSSTGSQESTAEDYVDADFSGDPLRQGFNVDYMLQALGEIRSDTARLQFAEAGHCLVTDPGDPNLTLTVSPMRL